MCEMCEGQTLERHLDRVRDLIRTHGWALQAVSGSGPVGWVYTVGLTTSYGHPELLTVDTDVGRAAGLLNGLGATVRDGSPLPRGAATTSDGTEVELVAVHPVHARSELLATWHALHHHEPSVGTPPALDVLQVRVPTVIGDGPRALRARLDQPHARIP